MKKCIKAFMMLSLLTFGISTLSMEKDDIQADDSSEMTIECLDKEILEMILQYITYTYFDENILVETQAKDIYEGLNTIKQTVCLYSKNIRLTSRSFNCIACKIFELMKVNGEASSLKQKLRDFYRIILNNKYLEHREGRIGLYPKNGEWDIDSSFDNMLAKFILTGNNEIGSIISDANELYVEIKLIVLLLFYGANVDSQGGNDTSLTSIFRTRLGVNQDLIALLLVHGADINLKTTWTGSTPLVRAIESHKEGLNNNKNVIVFLLVHDANVNLQTMGGFTALTEAICRYGHRHNNKDIIALLLAYGADADLLIMDGKTNRDIARGKNFEKFNELVEIYSPKKTLKSLCIKFILTYQELFQAKLSILPTELRNLFNFD